MIKRIFALIICVLTVLPVLAGCHGTKGQEPFVLPEAFDETKQYEITFWAKNDTNINQVNIYNKTIEDFQKLYPNITVNLRLYTDYGKIYNDVITNIATGTTPNVCITYPDHIATYMTGDNTVVPLDGLLEDPRYGLGGSEIRFDAPRKEEIVPQFLSECMLNGAHYALPYMRSTEACYVNKSYVEALGYTLPDVLTWDFVWEVSEAAMEQDADGNYKINGQKVLIPFIYKSADNMMIQMLRQKDAGYSTESGEILLFNETTGELLDTVAGHVKNGAFSVFTVSGYPANFLNAGQCIFAVDSTAGATWMGSDAPLMDISEDRIVKFETEVKMIPQFDPENPQMISQGPSVCVFNKKNPQEVLASWIFTQYLLTNEVQISYSQTEGYVPVTLKAQNSAEYTDYLSRIGEDNDLYYRTKLEASILLLENVENTFVTPVFNGSASLRDAAGELIVNVTKSVRRKQTVDDAFIEKLYANTNALYRLDSVGTDSVGGKKDLGPLPGTAITLLGTLGIVWLGIAAVFIKEKIKNHRK